MSQKKSRIKRQIARVLATGTFAAVCQPAFASGFQILEQNVTNLGTAYAGTAALAADASTGYFNPAGLTRICKEQIAGSLIWIQGHPRLHVDSATTSVSLPPLAPNRVVAPGAARPSAFALIPTLHYASPICGDWTFGFNVTSPFGLRNNYTTNSVARYTATRSELRTVDLSPSIAYKIWDCFSIGAGYDALYTYARLDQNVGQIANPAFDGYIENAADGWGHGYHVGLLWEITDCTRIGVNYRSKVKVHVKGESLLQNPNAFALNIGDGRTVIFPVPAALNPLQRRKVTSEVGFPESVTVSGFHAFSDAWAAMADVQWTHWKRFQSLVLRFETTLANAPGTVISNTQSTTENFKDTYRVALGTAYRFCDTTTLRLGVAYDRTPVRDRFRTIRIPDSDRTWASIGAQYALNECMAIDVGYAHLFFRRATINEAAPVALGTGSVQGVQTLRGRNFMAADIVGIQFTWTLG